MGLRSAPHPPYLLQRTFHMRYDNGTYLKEQEAQKANATGSNPEDVRGDSERRQVWVMFAEHKFRHSGILK